MVPSWTETLLFCGANVVGRTRFCIHPKDSSAKPVGGTKDWDLETVSGLEADLIIFDREENPKSMADAAPAPWIATDIKSVHDVGPELLRLSEALAKDAGVAVRLRKLSERWTHVLAKAARVRRKPAEAWPGVIEWLRPPDHPTNTIAYVIWRSPWMTVSSSTFIGSVLEVLGFGIWRPPQIDSQLKYPVFEFESIPRETIVFFSTEPFPFAKKKADLILLNRPCALVDGEKFSWFGLRTLEFLESVFFEGREEFLK